MTLNKSISNFTALLITILGFAFFLHILLLQNKGLPLYENKIVLSYIINGLLAAAITIFLFYYKAKLKNYIGFLFMGGSFLKFIFFFILFYPGYQVDGELNRLEFAAFFIPYGICLALETIFIAKMLQKLDY